MTENIQKQPIQNFFRQDSNESFQCGIFRPKTVLTNVLSNTE